MRISLDVRGLIRRNLGNTMIKLIVTPELHKVEAKLRKIEKNQIPALSKALSTGVRDIKLTAKQLAPYRTGNLRRSIYGKKIAPLKAEIGVDPGKAPYGACLELGFKHIKTGRFIRRPYLMPAVRQNIPNLRNLIKKALKQSRGG